MAVHVDSTAIVDPHAVLEDEVSIGPYCVVSGGAFLGEGTRLISHVSILGNVRMGRGNVVYPNCVIGAEPQDLGYRGEPTWVVIGDNNTFREAVTVHRATVKEFGVTRVESNNYFMAMVHIAHDVKVGSHVIIANMTQLSGHVHVEDHAVLSGMVGVHHFATIGRYAFVSGTTPVRTDIPPYMLAEGWPAEIRKVNIVGMRRNGFTREDIQSVSEAHRLLYRRQLAYEQARSQIEAEVPMTAPVRELLAFLDRQRSGAKGRGREGRKAA